MGIIRSTYSKVWGVELSFQRLPGVTNTAVGYTNGNTAHPTYRDVSSGTSGHAEAVQISFDSSVISYKELLSVFWERHNPTTLNRQGNDAGTQYRSGIFTHGPKQMEEALASKAEEQERLPTTPIVTVIEEAGVWHAAEGYHQHYLEKGGQTATKGSHDHIRCYG